MSRRAKWLGGVSAVVALVFAWLTWRNVAAVRHARSAHEALGASVVASERETKAVEARAQAARARVERLKDELRAIDAEKNAKAIAAKSEGPAKKSKPRSLSIAHLIRNEPDAQVLFLEKLRGDLRVTYGPLFRQLGLAAEKQAAFAANVIARNERWMDLDNIAQEEGADAAAVAKLRIAVSAEYEAAQRALLGEAGTPRWQEYERTSAIRQMVSAMAGVAVLEGVPMSAAQADDLVRVIAQTSERFARGASALMDSVDWTAAESQIRAVLSPSQYEVFRTMDPGPTTGGLQQALLYAEVALANTRDRPTSPGK